MDKTKITAGVFIALSVLLGGAVYFESHDDIYYCQSRDLVGYCEKLSSGTGTRCYFNDTYKSCPEGWKKIDEFIETNNTSSIFIFGNGEMYSCSVPDNKLNSYSVCVSPTGKEAYAGELI